MNEQDACLDSVKIDQKQIELGHELGDWFIFRESRHFGPLTTEQINQFLFSRIVSVNHHIWRSGFNSWVQIRNIEGFLSLGHSEIESVSDNEFSEKMNLGAIDRIRYDIEELTFSEGSRTKSGETEPRFVLGLSRYLEVFRRHAVNIGVPENKLNHVSAGLCLLAAMLVCSIAFKAYFMLGANKFVFELPKEQRAKLDANNELIETTKSPNLVFFEKDRGLVNPIFIGHVNLPVGSKIEINIEGDPLTLLGAYRFSKTFEIQLKSKYFQTAPLLDDKGKSIPPGLYRVSVSCLSCEKPDFVLLTNSYRLGVAEQEGYVRALMDFHTSAREAAKVEISDLYDLDDSLLHQMQSSVSVYKRSIGSGLISMASWTSFSESWQLNHKKIIEKLKRTLAEGYQSNVYYLKLYESYFDVTKSLSDLHSMQNKYLVGGDKNTELAQRISETTLIVKQNLVHLKSQVDLMNKNYNRSSGLPSKEGLSLSNLK